MTAFTASLLPPMPNATPSKPSLDLTYYVRQGKTELAIQMLEKRADPNVRRNGFSMLHLATNVDIVRALLLHRADVNIPTEGGFTTPLHTASVNGRIAIVQLLLEAKANVTAANESVGQPLRYALESEDPENGLACAKLLIEARADLNKVDEATNLSPLSLACRNGHLAAVRLLIEARANPSPDSGISPIAEALPFPPIVRFLEALHAQPKKDSEPKTDIRRKKRGRRDSVFA